MVWCVLQGNAITGEEQPAPAESAAVSGTQAAAKPPAQSFSSRGALAKLDWRIEPDSQPTVTEGMGSSQPLAAQSMAVILTPVTLAVERMLHVSPA